MTQSLENKIRERAYQLWERDGRVHGKADEHWLKASLEVIGSLAEEELSQTSSSALQSKASARSETMQAEEEAAPPEASKPRRRAAAKKTAEPKPVSRPRKGTKGDSKQS
jgi:hypothetical protein